MTSLKSAFGTDECRAYYRQQCKDTSQYWHSLPDEDKNKLLHSEPIHLSFNYAQNLQIPYQPQQVGPLYFKTPRKCHLFGVCCEVIPRQANFLIDEAALTGKGAYETISYLEHYLKHHAVKSTHLLIHCDNRRGQNENNAVMQYLHLRANVSSDRDLTDVVNNSPTK